MYICMLRQHDKGFSLSLFLVFGFLIFMSFLQFYCLQLQIRFPNLEYFAATQISGFENAKPRFWVPVLDLCCLVENCKKVSFKKSLI